MNPPNDTPIYNLKAIVQETGIKPDTLRAWERRYNVPKPQRAESGHRLYTHNDIKMLHWLLARQGEGLSISHAIEMWQQMQQSNDSALVAEKNGSTALTSVTSSLRQGALGGAVATNIQDEGTIAEMREQWINACLKFDQLLADQVLTLAFALFPTETVCLKLIQKGISQIGEGWHRGMVTVQQEHFASSLALRRLETMLNATPPAIRQGRILISTPPKEEHSFVALLLSLLLRRRGWDVVYLGGNIPITHLDITLQSIKPQLVILTAQQLQTAATLFEMSQILLQTHTPLAFGGQIFTQIPDIIHLIPGYFLGNRVEDAVSEVEQIMESLRVKFVQRTVEQKYHDAMLHFQERRTAIEMEIGQHSARLGMSPNELTIANERLGTLLSAALQLGDMTYIEPSLVWLKSTLMTHHHVTDTIVKRYLDAYRAALQKNLDGRGEVIHQWFAANQDK